MRKTVATAPIGFHHHFVIRNIEVAVQEGDTGSRKRAVPKKYLAHLLQALCVRFAQALPAADIQILIHPQSARGPIRPHCVRFGPRRVCRTKTAQPLGRYRPSSPASTVGDDVPSRNDLVPAGLSAGALQRIFPRGDLVEQGEPNRSRRLYVRVPPGGTFGPRAGYSLRRDGAALVSAVRSHEGINYLRSPSWACWFSSSAGRCSLPESGC